MELFDHLRGIIGIAVLMGLAWAISENRKGHPGWRWIAGALVMQGLLAVVIVRVPAVWAAVGLVNNAVSAVEAATLK
ncbi:MAG TPA: Na+ dependent nucleoside transporter N-terminal domain-containing protein, partial [Erythrobacter sp.]